GHDDAVDRLDGDGGGGQRCTDAVGDGIEPDVHGGGGGRDAGGGGQCVQHCQRQHGGVGPNDHVVDVHGERSGGWGQREDHGRWHGHHAGGEQFRHHRHQCDELRGDDRERHGHGGPHQGGGRLRGQHQHAGQRHHLPEHQPG